MSDTKPDYTKMNCQEILNSWDIHVDDYFEDRDYDYPLIMNGRRIIQELISRLGGKDNA